MIQENEYLKAKKIVDDYKKQLRIGNVSVRCVNCSWSKVTEIEGDFGLKSLSYTRYECCRLIGSMCESDFKRDRECEHFYAR